MLSEYITSLADFSFHIVAYRYARFRYSGKNPMRFAVFWCISVRFCGFRTPLTPPSYICERESELGCFLVSQKLQLVRNDVVVWPPFSLFIPLSYGQTPLNGAVSRNSATLGNYKMPVKLRET